MTTLRSGSILWQIPTVHIRQETRFRHPLDSMPTDMILTGIFPIRSAIIPHKQKETLDMMKFMRSHNFVLSANFHSGEEVVNYPWDRWEIRHPDDNWFYYISRKYADTVHIHSAAGYMTFLDNGVTNGWDWYAIYGGRQDYVTWELHGREVTIELDDNFITPISQLGSLWEANYRSLIGYLENALYGIRGTVTDNITGEAVPAKVFIEGHDADNSSCVYATRSDRRLFKIDSPGNMVPQVHS